MIRKAAISLAVFSMALAAFAADVSGTWTGVFKTREGGAFETTLNLKADGDKLTGTFQQGSSDEIQIENGKTSGDQVSFTLTRGTGERTRKVNYNGKVEGNSMKLSVSVEGAQRTQEITLTKK